MSSDFHYLPIVPASPSLASHLQALDLLAARLSSLSTRAEWETRVHLNSKASIGGKIVNTSTVKINVGGEWWVDMTPQEGEAWVRRRKAALLEEHAKVLEGWRPGTDEATLEEPTASASRKPSSSFDPVFRSPVVASKDESASQPDLRVQEEGSQSQADSRKAVPTSRPVAPVPLEQDTSQTLNASAGPSKPRIPTAPPQTVQDVLATFMEKQEALAKATGKSSMPNGDAADAMVNEEGLPIHEIREDENGQLLGDLPKAVQDAEGGVAASITEIPEEKKEDFWSDTAAARRAALRRKVFDDSPDFSSDDDDDRPAALPPTPPEPSSSPRQNTSGPSINAIPPTPSSPRAPSPPLPVRRPSSSALPGKSILKPSAPRKKSVSFDSSVPEPPDSPGPSTTKIGGSMFPTPVINIESGIEEKKVPVLNAPKRSPKRNTFGDPFAGFKPGFLSGGSGSGKLAPSTPAVLSDEPESSDTPEVPELRSASSEESAGKKPSLFAQRQRSTEESEVLSSSPQTTPGAPSFPALSTSKGTSSVKNAVLEKAPPQRPTQTAGVAQQVTERPISAPTAGPSRERSNGINGGLSADEDDDEDDDDDDDDSFYQDDDDEEEYDLDDAMLAREVALAYHQNRAYTELGRLRSSQYEGEGDEEGEQGEGEGGVMLALPEISVLGDTGSPRIVNPTPDSLRRFVRVGKLDNGKLVLAPGEAGWSDEEEEGGGGDDVRKENREEIRRALLGQADVKERKATAQAVTQDVGLPPTVGSAGTTAMAAAQVPPTRAVGGVKENSGASAQVINAPKKVSRFKADRMGNGS